MNYFTAIYYFIHGKIDFVKIFKNLTRYRSENFLKEIPQHK